MVSWLIWWHVWWQLGVSCVALCRCLWFLMEPLIKSENYNFTFYKKMLEKIKQCKDAVCPENDEANQVFVYCLCFFTIFHLSLTIEAYAQVSVAEWLAHLTAVWEEVRITPQTVVFIATAAAIYSLGHGLCTFTAVLRLTQASTLMGP